MAFGWGLNVLTKSLNSSNIFDNHCHFIAVFRNSPIHVIIFIAFDTSLLSCYNVVPYNVMNFLTIDNRKVVLYSIKYPPNFTEHHDCTYTYYMWCNALTNSAELIMVSISTCMLLCHCMVSFLYMWLTWSRTCGKPKIWLIAWVSYGEFKKKPWGTYSVDCKIWYKVIDV